MRKWVALKKFYILFLGRIYNCPRIAPYVIPNWLGELVCLYSIVSSSSMNAFRENSKVLRAKQKCELNNLHCYNINTGEITVNSLVLFWTREKVHLSFRYIIRHMVREKGILSTYIFFTHKLMHPVFNYPPPLPPQIVFWRFDMDKPASEKGIEDSGNIASIAMKRI